MGYEKFLELLSTFSPDFPVKDSWEFSWIFHKIATWDKQENLKLGYFYDIYIFLNQADKRKSTIFYNNAIMYIF